MSLETGKCDICGKMTNEFTLFGDMEMCDDCFKELITIMSYKNYNDMKDDEKALLQVFCNKFVKQLFVEEEK